MIRAQILLGATLASLTILLTSTAAGAQTRQASYRVVAGDTLYVLANRYLAVGKRARDLQRLNKILDPRRLGIGRLLAIPIAWLKREQSSAQLAAFKGSVNVQIDRKHHTAAVGLRVPTRSTVATQDRSFASLVMQDGSQLMVMPESRIRIETLQRVVLTKSLERKITVEQGRVQARVIPISDSIGSFQLQTPLVVAAVRGTEFRTTYDEASRTSRVEVLKGRVEVVGDGRDLLVAGQGMVVDTSGMGAKEQLLAAPEVLNPGRTQSDDRLHFRVAPQPGAVAYQMIVAADAGFVELLNETRAPMPDVQMEAPADGIYFVRVSALTPQGVEGLSRDYSFERRRYAFGAEVAEDGAAGQGGYRFRWLPDPDERVRFRFVLTREGGHDWPLVDEVGLQASEIVLNELPAGTYRWKVGRWVMGQNPAQIGWDEENVLIVAASR